MRGHTNERPYNCKRCNKQYKTNWALKVHLLIHGGEASKVHLCLICEKKFRSIDKLSNHIRMHTRERPYQCNLCSSAFAVRTNLTIHKTQKHNIGVKRKCPVCNKSLVNNQSSFEYHMRTHTGEKPFQCSICRKEFATSTCLKKHKVSHELLKRFSCKICGKSFKSVQILNSHSKKHTENGKTYQCPECPKSYYGYSSSSLNIHIRRVHINHRPHSCGICGKAFFTKTSRDHHIRNHLGERFLKCSLCQYETTGVSNLSVHLKRHARHPSFPCTKCSFQYPTNLELLRHYIKVHVGSDQDFLQCFFCGVIKPGTEKTEVHSRTHTKERPYFCKRCPMDFAAKKDLRKHIIYDHKNGSEQPIRPAYERPAKCDVCGIWIKKGNDLKRHMNRHLRVENFPCTKCNYKFFSELTMLRHYLKDHSLSNEDVLRCVFCGRRFLSLLDLENHTRGHLGERPHFCSRCVNSYQYQRTLERHVATVHKQRKA